MFKTLIIRIRKSKVIIFQKLFAITILNAGIKIEIKREFNLAGARASFAIILTHLGEFRI